MENPKKKIEDLLAFRNPVYESVADIILEEKNKSLDDVFYELSDIVRDM